LLTIARFSGVDDAVTTTLGLAVRTAWIVYLVVVAFFTGVAAFTQVDGAVSTNRDVLSAVIATGAAVPRALVLAHLDARPNIPIAAHVVATLTGTSVGVGGVAIVAHLPDFEDAVAAEGDDASSAARSAQGI